MSGILDRSRPLLCFVHDARDGTAPEGLWRVPAEAWSLVDLVQVRGKQVPAGELEDLTRAWIARLTTVPTRVVVNDRLDVALAAGADGVHLGQDDLPLDVARSLAPPGFLLGASTHDRGELLAAQEAGADYAGLGAFFGSGTKVEAQRLDPSASGVVSAVPGLAIPVLAIGGVAADKVAEAVRVPAVTGIAVSAAIQVAGDPEAAIRRLRRALERAWETALEAVVG